MVVGPLNGWAHPRRAAHRERSPAVQRPDHHRARALRGPARCGPRAGATPVVPGDRLVRGGPFAWIGLLLAAGFTQAGARARSALPHIADNSCLLVRASKPEPAGLPN